jgi:hypothetical protein
MDLLESRMFLIIGLVEKRFSMIVYKKNLAIFILIFTMNLEEEIGLDSTWIWCFTILILIEVK